MRLNRLFSWIFTSLCLVAAPSVAQPVDTVVAANYAPLMIQDDPERPGYAVEVLHEAARRCGRSIDITFMPFERAMLSLRSETDVIMPALFFGKKQNNAFQWLVEINSANLRVATIGDRVDTLEAARKLSSIAVESGTTADAMLTELGFDNLVRTVAPESSGLMLAAGRVDAWFQDGNTIRNFWTQLELTEPLVFGEVLREVPIYLVASTGLNAKVADGYRIAVENMRADGTLDKIAKRYGND